MTLKVSAEIGTL